VPPIGVKLGRQTAASLVELPTCEAETQPKDLLRRQAIAEQERMAFLRDDRHVAIRAQDTFQSVVWRDNLDENGAAIRMRSGGRGASWSRRTRTDARPL
jgi:hypothetical protein